MHSNPTYLQPLSHLSKHICRMGINHRAMTFGLPTVTEQHLCYYHTLIQPWRVAEKCAQVLRGGHDNRLSFVTSIPLCHYLRKKYIFIAKPSDKCLHRVSNVFILVIMCKGHAQRRGLNFTQNPFVRVLSFAFA